MRKNKGYVLPIVVVLISVAMATVAAFISTILTDKTDTDAAVSFRDADFNMQNRVRFFRSALEADNDDGKGYSPTGASRLDGDGDDDDYDGTASDIDGIPDNDGNAFKYRFGVLATPDDENVLYVDRFARGRSFGDEKIVSFRVLSDGPIGWESLLFEDGSADESVAPKMKSRTDGSLASGNGTIPVPSGWAGSDTPIALFFSNPGNVPVSYRISAMGENGQEIAYFEPVSKGAKDFDYHASVLVRDGEGGYFVRKKTFFSVLAPYGRKPTAPSYLRSVSGSGTDVSLAWDVNAPEGIDSLKLYRSSVAGNPCDGQLFRTFTPNVSSVVFPAESGSFHYSACSVSLTENGDELLSTPSNELNVMR